MTQELIDLRLSILERRYDDALAIVDELEGMSKQAILRNIESFLVRLLIHLIKNHLEQRLTNSWAASISDSVRQIQKLNLKDNNKSYYINADEWESVLDNEFEAAIDGASVEVLGGIYTPFQLLDRVTQEEIVQIALKLLHLTYDHSAKTLTKVIRETLIELPGGENWFSK